jgi:hypothetical protein
MYMPFLTRSTEKQVCIIGSDSDIPAHSQFVFITFSSAQPIAKYNSDIIVESEEPFESLTKLFSAELEGNYNDHNSDLL